jgi:RES domain-containing protein
MLAWRIEYARHLEDALSGDGARRYGGRWNEKGVSVVYLSSHLGLAALEKFVHAAPTGRGIALHAVAVEIASRHIQDAHRPGQLPDDWRDGEPGMATMSWGSRWARSRQSLVALVPSALLPLTCFEHSWEFNLMLNPEHEAMGEVRILERPRYSFDPRMWQGKESSARG